MKLFKTATLVALTMLIGASIAYGGSAGGNGDLDRTRDRLQDGSCTTAALQTQSQDQLRTKDQLRDCTVAQLQTQSQDQLRTKDQLRDCTFAQLQTRAQDCTSPDCPCPDDCLNTQTRTRTGGANG
jgi:hypothetical protein